jgi:cell division protein FtsL
MVADFFKKQKGGEYKLMLKTFAILFLAVTILLIFANIKLYNKKQELKRQIENYSLQIEKIQKNNEKLKEEIANSDNQDYIEKVAREEINMQKSGENAVSFVMSEELENLDTSAENILSPNFWIAGFGRFWEKIKRIF